MVSILQRVGPFLLLLILTACSDSPEGHLYFPLQEGLSWKYRVTTSYSDQKTEHELTIENLGQQEERGKTYFIRRTSSGIDYYINSDAEGVYREGLRTLVETHIRPDKDKRFVFKLPVETGTNWLQVSYPMVFKNVVSNGQRMVDYKAPFAYTITSTNETVTVPAGTFKNCILVRGEGQTEIYTDAINGFNEIPMIVEEWYAPGVGLIKQNRYELEGEIITIANKPAFYGGRTTLELVTFSQ